MILKVLIKRESGDEWVIFSDFDRVRYRILRDNEAIPVCSDVADLCADQEFHHPKSTQESGSGIGPKREIWLLKGGDVKAQIIAHAPIFLCNESGKTIERL